MSFGSLRRKRRAAGPRIRDHHRVRPPVGEARVASYFAWKRVVDLPLRCFSSFRSG